MTLNDLCFGNQNFFKDISANVAKEILKGNTPVYRSKSIYKDEILLTEHFDETLHIALSNDSIARMSKAESSIFLDFIKYQDYKDTGIALGEPEPVYSNKIDEIEAINTWLLNEIFDRPNNKVNETYNVTVSRVKDMTLQNKIFVQV